MDGATQTCMILMSQSAFLELIVKNLFSSHFAADVERRDALWKNCIFVFDTNVLTSVYKRSDEARDALYKVIQSLGDRLWIPYQVIHELLDNRASITHAQAGLYAAAVENLNSVLDNFDSATKHPFLSEGLHAEFFSVSRKVIDELELKRSFHDFRLTEDDVKAALAEMLIGKVGLPYSEEQLKAVVKEGEARYANRIPPGFEDIKKYKDSKVFSEVCKRYGDLIIWKQVIEKAKVVDKPVIFVTGEQKDDWWDRHGGKTIGPLPQLIEEFSAEVGKDFYLYSHHQFLDLANTYLEQTTSSEVIEEVREAALDDEAEWTLLNDDGSPNQAWRTANFESFDFTEGNKNAVQHAQEFTLTPEWVASVRAVAEQLIAARNTNNGAPNVRSPNDPREVRRRKREVERLALEAVREEQKRIAELKARQGDDGES